MALVLWSGGCDSTLALTQLAKKFKRHKEPVRAISIQHPQITAAEEAYAARVAIKRWLMKHKYKITFLTVNITHYQGHIERGDGLPQPALWLTQAINYLNPSEDLYLGYVKEDAFWHYRALLEQAFTALQGVLGRTGKIIYPLEWTSKEEVLIKLDELGIADLCWHCEQPTREHAACGKCHPCERYEDARNRVNKRRKKLNRDATKEKA